MTFRRRSALGLIPTRCVSFESCDFRHEVPTYPMPGLTSPGFEAREFFSPEGGDISTKCVDPSGLKPRYSDDPVPSTPAEVVSGLRP